MSDKFPKIVKVHNDSDNTCNIN